MPPVKEKKNPGPKQRAVYFYINHLILLYITLVADAIPFCGKSMRTKVMTTELKFKILRILMANMAHFNIC
jgi:hypothetical protein